MSKIQEITKFVEDVFDRYRANKYGFFFVYNERTMKEIPRPLFPSGTLDDGTLQRIAICLGLTKEEIVNMDEQAATRYWNKYPFFRLYHQYMGTWYWHQNFIGEMPTFKELLLKAIFSDADNVYGERRYDYNDLQNRLTSTLKEMNQAIPGIYHEGAEITDLRIFTQIFFSFPQCSAMIRSFIDMVKRTEELFFSALHRDLDVEDANELNFLASWLYAVDVVMPSVLITYDNVCTYRKVYLEENSQDFFSYVKIKNFIKTEPWRCQEFFENMDLVREFLYIFPDAKANMRKFAFDVTKISCMFVWSDAKPVRLSEEDEWMCDVIDESLGLESLTDSERPKEVTHIYIDKKPEEMQGWGKFAKQLQKAAGPASKGGIAIPNRRAALSDWDEAFRRMQKRVSAKHGGAENG